VPESELVPEAEDESVMVTGSCTDDPLAMLPAFFLPLLFMGEVKALLLFSSFVGEAILATRSDIRRGAPNRSTVVEGMFGWPLAPGERACGIGASTFVVAKAEPRRVRAATGCTLAASCSPVETGVPGIAEDDRREGLTLLSMRAFLLIGVRSGVVVGVKEGGAARFLPLPVV
jgi:hypothetical protein